MSVPTYNSSQMGRIDENQEVVAQIRSAIEAYDKSRLPDDVIEEDEIPDSEENNRAHRESRSWRLGAASQPTTGKWLERDFVRIGMSSSFYKNFDAHLKEFLIANTPCSSVAVDSTVKVSLGG